MKFPLKIKNKTQFSNPTPGHISVKDSNSKRCMHPSVYGSTVYNSQDKEATT